jgi:hypothetical protein
MPIFIYGAENWTYTMADFSRLMAAELSFLMSTEGKIRKVGIRNEESQFEGKHLGRQINK